MIYFYSQISLLTLKNYIMTFLILSHSLYYSPANQQMRGNDAGSNAPPIHVPYVNLYASVQRRIAQDQAFEQSNITYTLLVILFTHYY